MNASLLPPFPNLPTKKQCALIADALLPWFATHQRPLPWRRDCSPYAVWISEIMLQQTQMERGVSYFHDWMQRFPDVATLAAASLDEVYKAWEGLGYYTRAKNLHAAAHVLVDEYAGTLPQTPEQLEKLPGIGRYTAGAIASIAYNQPAPIVDANIERVFSRLFNVPVPCKSIKARDFFWHTAKRAIPQGQARHFNQALMELGALVCKKRPLCNACPFVAVCRAHEGDLVYERPVTGKKPASINLALSTGILVHNGRALVQKRLDQGAWAGLWEFPGGEIEENETPEQAVLREFFEETELVVQIKHKLGVVRHAHTRYKITLHAFFCTLQTPQGSVAQPSCTYPTPVLHAATAFRWATANELETLAFPAGHRKILDLWPHPIADAVKASQMSTDEDT